MKTTYLAWLARRSLRCAVFLVSLSLTLVACSDQPTPAALLDGAAPSPTALPASPAATAGAVTATAAAPNTPTSTVTSPTIALPATASPIPTPTATPNYANSLQNNLRAETTPSVPPPPFRSRFAFQPDDVITQLEPGVIEVTRTVWGRNPLHTHVLLFDLTAPQFASTVATRGDDLSGVARTSVIAASHKALAGVNGDLFSGEGLPQGLTILDGRVAIAPKHRATFAWTKTGDPFIGYFTDEWTWHSQVTANNGDVHPLQLLNYPCKPAELCLYNDLYGQLPYQYGDIKVVLDATDQVTNVVANRAVNIPTGSRVLWGAGETAGWLSEHMHVGDTISVDTQTTQPLDNYRYAVSGGPIILQNGQFNQDCLCDLGDCRTVPERLQGDLCEEFPYQWKLLHYLDIRMPRVGVGFDTDKRTLVVAEVDGYQPGFSVGIRQDDFAMLFKEFGATTAMELDGGGSATMWADGKVISRPSDGNGNVERQVPDALLFFWRDTPIPTPNVR